MSAHFAERVQLARVSHNLREPFWGAKYLSDVAWGLAAVATMAVSPSAGISVLALVLYWVVNHSIDYVNHRIGAAIALLGSYVVIGADATGHIYLIGGCVAAYALAKLVRTWSINRYPSCRRWWRLRPQIYLVTFGFGLVLGNQEPLLTAVAAMVPTEALTIWYSRKSLAS